MDDTIIVTNNYYIINNLDEVPNDITYSLGKWDKVYYKIEPIGYFYNEKTKELRIPSSYPLNYLTNIFPDRYIIKNTDFKITRDQKYMLTGRPKNYIQAHELAYMLGQPPYEVTNKCSQLYVDLDTGEGKTFCGIAACCYYQCTSVIFIPPISKVADQWMESIDKFTTLRRNEYLYVKGSKVCLDIIDGKYDNVKIFIIPRSTILAFVRMYDNDWGVFERLMAHINPSVQIMDEAHMNFSTMVNILCHTSVPKTYYMSSSPTRSDISEKKIYNKIFKDVPKYGKSLKSKEQNHIIPLVFFYRSTPSHDWLRKIKTRYGTSLSKYAEYLLAEDGAKDEFVEAFIFSIYFLLQLRKDCGKFLVICSTVDFIEKLSKITKSIFPYLSIGKFIGSGKEKNKELDNDIVFSTIKSMGTGSEIKNHQFTINVTTYASDVLADQVMGRLRKTENKDRKPIYCELVNIKHPVASKHYKEREPILRKKAKDGVLLTMDITQKEINDCYRFLEKYRYNEYGQLVNKNGAIVIKRK